MAADTGFRDSNGDDSAETNFAAMGKSGAAAAFVMGDLAYQRSEQKYCDVVNQLMKMPIEIVPGNHEGLDPAHSGQTSGSIMNYVKCLPDRLATKPLLKGKGYPYNYVVDLPKVRIIMISPNVVSEVGQLTFANGTPEQVALLAAIKEGKKAGQWIIVGEHEPWLTIGEHAAEPDNLSTPDLARAQIAAGVDLVIAGHDHNYSRTHQLSALESQTSATIADDDNSFVRGAGTVFAVIGNSGHIPREIGDPGTMWASSWGTNSPGGTSIGFLQVDATAESLSVSEITTSGAERSDSFVISKAG